MSVSSATKPDIVLNSPVGGKPAVYKWPFHYMCKGLKIDGSEEIIETIRWVAREFIEFKPAIENILPEQLDTKDYDFIKSLCDRYNKILETVTRMNRGTSVAPKTSSRASQGLLKHIIQQVYNYAVADPTELNKYSPFSSETYGETNFEFMAQLIEKNQFRPKENDTFIDMGSGVGHIVLQTAASVECKKCYGIEISDVPAGYAKRMEERFKFWMAWHGKTYTEFELIHGDFFDRKYADIIENATYILVNNYAFKPEVDYELKKRFEDLNDGVQILSSKPFCSPKSRVSERHMGDMGSIMRVVEIHPEQKKDSVSWTPKPLPYYLHILDGSPIHKFYERKQRKNGSLVDRGCPVKRRKARKRTDSDGDSDENVVYGPTTRKAWSEWCNSTTASNRVSTESIKSSRNNSTDTENYECAIENEENANTNASANTAASAKSTKENDVSTKREKKVQESQGVATEKSASSAQGTSAQTKASQSASQAAKSCLDKKRDYASKKGASNSTQNEKSYSCLTKTSDSSNSSSPSKVPPLVIKVTPPVESKSTEEPPKSSVQTRNEAQKLEPKVNDENGKQLRQRKRAKPAQTATEKPNASTAPKVETVKQGTRASKAVAQNLTPSTSVTRGSKRTQQAAKLPAAKAAPARKRRATSSDKTSSLDLLHTKTIESVSSNAGYFPQPAPGCEDYNLRSIVDTPSLPKVTIKDVGMFSDYVKRGEDKCLDAIRADLNTFLKKTQQPGVKEILTQQIHKEQMNNAMFKSKCNELERENKFLDDRTLKVMKPHCDIFAIKNTFRSIVSYFGVLLKQHQDLTAQVSHLEATFHSNQRTMNPPAAHSNSSQCLSSPYHRSSSSSVTLDLSLNLSHFHHDWWSGQRMTWSFLLNTLLAPTSLTPQQVVGILSGVQTMINNMRRLFITDFHVKRLASSNVTNLVQPFEAIPGPKPLPFIGNIWRYLPIIGEYDVDNLYENAQLNKKRYGPIVREQITRNHVVLHLFDPTDIKEFFRQDSNEPYRRSHRALLKLRHEDPRRYNDGGIFPENGPNWSRLRSLFNQSLMSRNSVTRRAPILDAITKQQIYSISSRQVTISQSSVQIDNFEQFLYRWSVKCALAVFLDFSNSSMPNDEFLDQIIAYSNDQLEALAGTEIKSDRWLKNSGKCPFYQKLIKGEKFMYEFVSTRVNHLSKTNSLGAISFLREWLEDDGIDHKDVITFLVDSVLADIHTTVYTCMFLLEDISRRIKPGLKEQLLLEISGSFPPNGSDDFIKKDIGEELPLLKYCLRETLRLHPVSIGTGRLTKYEMLIANYRIPKDVMVIAHNQVISRDSKIYKDPDEFDPLRWDESGNITRLDRPSPFAWLPFGFGPRACLGQRLVSLQICILTIRLLEKYSVQFCSEIKTKTNLVHQLVGPISVKLHAVSSGDEKS